MKKLSFFPFVSMSIGFFLILGCENAKETIGLTKQSPDEFAVVTRAPLSIPPKFDLRPPKPGADRPQETAKRLEARKILLKNASRNRNSGKYKSVNSDRFSNGEAAFLQRAGALNVDPSIRKIIKKESSGLTEVNEGLLGKIIFWRNEEKPGSIIDAKKEAQRLRKVTAEGQSITKGKTPTIIRKQKGWLEGIF